MSLSTGPATIAFSKFEHNGVTTKHYPNMEAMLSDLLMNSGDKIPFLVRDKLLPPAVKAWEEQLRKDNCDHSWKQPDAEGYTECRKCGESYFETA